MAKSIDQQIKDAMAKKVVGRTTEIYKAVVLELYKRITANSLQVGHRLRLARADGRYYASHTIARGRIDTTVRDPNPDGDENPYPGLPLTNAAAALTGLQARARPPISPTACPMRNSSKRAQQVQGAGRHLRRGGRAGRAEVQRCHQDYAEWGEMTAFFDSAQGHHLAVRHAMGRGASWLSHRA